MIVARQEVLKFLEITSEEYDIDNIQAIHQGVEAFVKVYTNRTFGLTDYTKEVYSGTGNQYLALDNYPIINLDRISVGTRDAITIQNTANLGVASVAVLSTGLRLYTDAVIDVSLTFADYATITLLVDALNAVGSGWVATVTNANYADFKSTELIKCAGRSALSAIYLQIPEEALSDVMIYGINGFLYREDLFTAGVNNVVVDFSAGYLEIPNDLQFFTKLFIKHIALKNKQESIGLKRYTVGELSVIYEAEDFPKEIAMGLRSYNSYSRVCI